jgi:hypothetical protein
MKAGDPGYAEAVEGSAGEPRAALEASCCAGVDDPTLRRIHEAGGLAAILAAIGELRAAWELSEADADLAALACRRQDAAIRRLLAMTGEPWD